MLERKSKLKIYNKLTNELEEFKPIKDDEIVMYVCGPTVYNYIHIGNARPIIVFDVVHRYFKKLGYNVNFISNFTDIDDKIIERAKIENVSEAELANKYIEAYNNDWNNLNALPVSVRCKVTDYIEEIGDFISKLVANDHAYKIENDVYFRVNSIKNYGMLSNNNIEDLNAGERITVNDNKEHAADFTLWKDTEEGIKFPSAFGAGRPGWHTECVVMIKSLTDGVIDIHGGGHDLTFPHHENEIAQSVAYDGKHLANYWMHNGMLNVEGDKMSKSLGNVILTKDFIADYGGNILRLATLQTVYHNNITFNDKLLDDCIKLDERIANIYKKLSLNKQLIDIELKQPEQKYYEYLEDNFNTANLITYLLEVIKQINIDIRNNGNGLDYYHEFHDILYLLGLKYEYTTLSEADKEMYLTWQEARVNKDFETADKLRVDLVAKGIL